MDTTLYQRTLDECLALMDTEVQPDILDRMARYHAEGLIIFGCVDLASALVGDRFAIPYGPRNTLREVPPDGRCPVQPPRGSAWQYMVEAYC